MKIVHIGGVLFHPGYGGLERVQGVIRHRPVPIRGQRGQRQIGLRSAQILRRSSLLEFSAFLLAGNAAAGVQRLGKRHRRRIPVLEGGNYHGRSELGFPEARVPRRAGVKGQKGQGTGIGLGLSCLGGLHFLFRRLKGGAVGQGRADDLVRRYVLAGLRAVHDKARPEP